MLCSMNSIGMSLLLLLSPRHLLQRSCIVMMTWVFVTFFFIMSRNTINDSVTTVIGDNNNNHNMMKTTTFVWGLSMMIPLTTTQRIYGHNSNVFRSRILDPSTRFTNNECIPDHHKNNIATRLFPSSTTVIIRKPTTIQLLSLSSLESSCEMKKQNVIEDHDILHSSLPSLLSLSSSIPTMISRFILMVVLPITFMTAMMLTFEQSSSIASAATTTTSTTTASTNVMNPFIYTNDYSDPLHPLCERHIDVNDDGVTFHYSGTAVGPRGDPILRGCTPKEIELYKLRLGSFDGFILTNDKNRISVGDGIHEGIWESAYTVDSTMPYYNVDGIRWNDGNKWIVITTKVKK